MSTGSAVGQLADSHIIAVTDLEVFLLHTNLEDEGVGILDAIAEPHTHQEWHPIEIDTVEMLGDPRPRDDGLRSSSDTLLRPPACTVNFMGRGDSE